MARARKQQYFNRPNKDILAISPISFNSGTVVSGSTFASTPTASLNFKYKETGTSGHIGRGSVLGNLNTGIRTSNQILSEHTIITGDGNRVGPNSISVVVSGNNNDIGNRCVNSGVLGGDDNTIRGGVVNSWIIGSSNKSILNSNEIWIGNSIHIVDGVTHTSYQFIDGGFNANTNLNATTNYYVIDGTLDLAWVEFPADVIHMIDGGLDTYM